MGREAERIPADKERARQGEANPCIRDEISSARQPVWTVSPAVTAYQRAKDFSYYTLEMGYSDRVLLVNNTFVQPIHPTTPLLNVPVPAEYGKAISM